MKAGRIEEIARGMYQFEWCCAGCGHKLNPLYPDKDTNNNRVWYDYCPYCGHKLDKTHYCVTLDLQPDPKTRMYPDYWEYLKERNLVEGDRLIFQEEQLDKTTPPHVYINAFRRFVKTEEVDGERRMTDDVRFGVLPAITDALLADTNFQETTGYFH